MSTWKLSKYFSESGCQVAVFSFASRGHRRPPFAEIFAPETDMHGVTAEKLAALGKTLKEFRPDIVICQCPYEKDIGKALGREKNYLLLGCLRNTLYSVRLNIDQYSNQVLPQILHPVFRNAIGRFALQKIHRVRHGAMLKRILAVYDYFVMFGPPNLDELRFFVGDFDRSRIQLIPNSVPKVSTTLSNKEKRILWLGRLTEEQKRADLIVPYWMAVCDQLPEWQIDVVGDGPARSRIEGQVRDLGIERICLHGRQEPDKYFERASIFVMTSAWEGFPNTLIEAQSFGAVPILFDSFPNASWIVETGVNGFLVQPFDIHRMAKETVALASSTDLDAFMRRSLENAVRFQIDNVGGSGSSYSKSMPLHPLHPGDISYIDCLKLRPID